MCSRSSSRTRVLAGHARSSTAGHPANRRAAASDGGRGSWGSRHCSSRLRHPSSATTRRCSPSTWSSTSSGHRGGTLARMAAPITLFCGSRHPDGRRRCIRPILHSTPVRVLPAPPVAWGILARGDVGPPFLALVRCRVGRPVPPPVGARPVSFGTALLFWWPVVGADLSPYRLGASSAGAVPRARGCRFGSFLGLAISRRARCCIPTTRRSGGLGSRRRSTTRRSAGGIMWAAGDPCSWRDGARGRRLAAPEDREGKRVDERSSVRSRPTARRGGRAG